MVLRLFSRTCNNFRDRTPGTVQSLLDSLKSNSLEQRRPHNRLQMLYRISSELVNINLTSFCQHADPRTRGAQCLHQERTNHPILFNFFSCTIIDWNHHLFAITSVTSLQSSQNQLGSSLHNLQSTPTAPYPRAQLPVNVSTLLTICASFFLSAWALKPQQRPPPLQPITPSYMTPQLASTHM